jgi:hypothetical protein
MIIYHRSKGFVNGWEEINVNQALKKPPFMPLPRK